MAVSQTYKENILKPFTDYFRSYYGYYNAVHRDMNVESGLFKNRIVLSFANNFECPSFLLNQIRSHRQTINSSNIQIPLYSKAEKEIKTTSSIISVSSNKVSLTNHRLLKVISASGTYYVNSGIILDEDYNPILVCTCDVNMGDIMRVNNPKVYINPDIFKDLDNALYKDIVTKLIPVYMTEQVQMPYYETNRHQASYITSGITVVFEKYPNIHNSISPDTARYNEEIIKILEDNRQSLLDNV